MRRIFDQPQRSLTLRDLNGDTTLKVVASNQGEPYRETLLLTFESGAYGDYSRYEHLGSAELEAHEEEMLLDLLLARRGRKR